MSFTDDVKKELCGCDITSDTKDAFVYGILYGMKKNRNEPAADNAAAKCLKNLLAITAPLTADTDGAGFLKLVLSDSELKEKYHYERGGTDKAFVNGNDTVTGAFLRGVFISCGSVCIQKAGYHLEFDPGTEEKSRELCRIVNEQGMSVNISSRRGHYFVYSKNSENISDLLTYIGAMRSAMEIMNIKIYKEVRSGINRAVNCETANIGKTAAAAAKQLLDIRFIDEMIGLDKLSEDLREMALLRMENPDVPLSGLGKLTEPAISRSGVNHRLERISKKADELRNTK